MKVLLLSTFLVAVAATIARADCAAEFSTVMEAHQHAGPYHSSTLMNANGKDLNVEIDVVLPGKFHFIKNFDGTESIVTQTGGWVKRGDNWQTMPEKQMQQVSKWAASGLAGGFKDAKNIQCLGPQPIEGQSLRAFSFEREGDGSDARPNSHFTLYVSEKDLPAVVTADFQGKTQKSTVVQHVIFNPGIKVEPPSGQAGAATSSDKCINGLKAMAGAIDAAGPFHYSIKANDGGQQVAVDMDFILPESLRMVFGGEEQLVTATGAWQKVNGAWQPLEPGPARSLQEGAMNPWHHRLESVTNLQCSSPMDFEGKTYPAYVFDMANFMGSRAMHHVTIFKGDNNLPIAMKAQKGADSTMSARITYDPSIKIEAPN